jgi:NAD(P)-dependent dehydrogenase (short-subunit alcohol dehydrogenase family)
VATIAGRVALVQGASRGIGLALVRELRRRDPNGRVFATCRDPASAGALADVARDAARVQLVTLDVTQPSTVTEAAAQVSVHIDRIDLVVNCAGLLHDDDGLQPERRLRDVHAEQLAKILAVNASGALMVAQGFESLLRKGRGPVFAALSARVGSIADNRLGGWYGYRASKAALNMFMRSLSIEWARGSRPIRVVCLHPGTVDTDLSAPFSPGTRYELFTPERAAGQLLGVIDALGADETGVFRAWDGSAIPW